MTDEITPQEVAEFLYETFFNGLTIVPPKVILVTLGKILISEIHIIGDGYKIIPMTSEPHNEDVIYSALDDALSEIKSLIPEECIEFIQIT